MLPFLCPGCLLLGLLVGLCALTTSPCPLALDLLGEAAAEVGLLGVGLCKVPLPVMDCLRGDCDCERLIPCSKRQQLALNTMGDA